MVNTALLGDLVIPACLDCPTATDRLCEHDQQLLPLASAIARGFGATDANPRTGAFLIDADWLYNTIGPGPYETTQVDIDAAPEPSPHNNQPYRAALLINNWIVAFPHGTPGETVPVVVGRIPTPTPCVPTRSAPTGPTTPDRSS
jgi:hypothetical protein